MVGEGPVYSSWLSLFACLMVQDCASASWKEFTSWCGGVKQSRDVLPKSSWRSESGFQIVTDQGFSYAHERSLMTEAIPVSDFVSGFVVGASCSFLFMPSMSSACSVNFRYLALESHLTHTFFQYLLFLLRLNQRRLPSVDIKFTLGQKFRTTCWNIQKTAIGPQASWCLIVRCLCNTPRIQTRQVMWYHHQKYWSGQERTA